jgi:hypothetical protein
MEPVDRKIILKRRLKSILLVLFVLLVLIIVAFEVAWAKLRHETISTRTTLEVRLSYPDHVRLGESLVIAADMYNGESQTLTLVDVSVDGSLELNWTDGLELAATDPPFVTHDVPAAKIHYYFFAPQSLQSGQHAKVTLTFRTLRTGKFDGLLFVDVLTAAEERRHTPQLVLQVEIIP